MPQSLQEYAEWLDNRQLIWPKLPPLVKPKATPSLKPLPGIRAVTWSLYGTLLRIAGGRLLHRHPQPFPMQIALEKTIEEFNMWNSMSRKPGAPWEYMLTQYSGVLERQEMRGAKKRGDFPEIDSAAVWQTLIERLVKNEYDWDREMYGDVDELGLKVAYFFHMRLQALEATVQAVDTLNALADAGLVQGLLADAQPFTLVQMLRAFRQQGKLPPPAGPFRPECVILSSDLGIRKPSKSIYTRAVRVFQRLGIEPHEVLHLGSRMSDDLAVAKRHGLRTALYAGDAESLQASKQELKDPDVRPDRLLTELSQVNDVLGID